MSETTKATAADMPEKVMVEAAGGKAQDEAHLSECDHSGDILIGPNGEQYPTAEELKTLRRTHGHVPLLIYSIAFIELCERFSYYGTIIVFNNYINWPLPPGSTTGAAGTHGQAGALGYGTQAAMGLILFNSFWAFITPLAGGYLADTYWGRFKTINVAIGIVILGHIVIIISAIPRVLQNSSTALGIFIVGLIIFGVGVGFFKCNISPLVAEQYQATHPRPIVFTEKSGERVIHDPNMTLSRVYMRYYFFINIGSVAGQISMVYAEKYVGFWLSYLVPTLLFLFCPVVMIWCRNKYAKRPPTGSVLSNAFHLIRFAMKGNWSWNVRKMVRLVGTDAFWDKVKPSQIMDRPRWMTFDDAWVDEIRRGLGACGVFVFLPIYWLSFNQQAGTLITQAGTMKLNGVPNDIVTNLEPLTVLIFIPICDKLLYPFLARHKMRFTPLKRITTGLGLATLSMVAAAVLQHYIYAEAPCGDHATDSACIAELGPPDLSVWIQTPSYVLVALSEIMTLITTLEYAFTKAPRNMRSLVMGLFLFTNAFSGALSQALVPLSKDPLFIWLYVIIACITFVATIAFWFTFRGMDREEDVLNALPESTYQGRAEDTDVDPEALKQEQMVQDKIRTAQGLNHQTHT